MKKKIPASCLSLHELELSVFLGWPDEESAQAQRVILDIDIHFAAPPAACLSDDLKDTFSYDTLIEHIQKNTAAKKFRLLEHLGYALHQLIKTYIPEETIVNVSVKKHPAIAALKGGASFYVGDTPSWLYSD
jgi:FolB domain-containing protein